MDLSRWRFDHEPWYGWSVSAIVHLSIVLFLALLLMPLGDGSRAVLEVEVTTAEVGAELIVFEPAAEPLFLPDNEPAPSLFNLDSTLEIGEPLELVAVGGSAQGGVAGGQTVGSGSGAGQTSFFGTVASGNRFVYVLDVSPSMNARNGKRLERAVLELLRSIDQLNEKQQFYVLVFGWQTRQMFDDSDVFPGMVPGTLENKRRLRDWLTGVTTISGTDPREALYVSMSMQPSAVFFLSDGEFNKPKEARFFADNDDEAEDVVKAYGSGVTPIHTVAFEDPVSEKRMHAIAEMTNGQHIFIAAPEGSAEPRLDDSQRNLAYQLALLKFKFNSPSEPDPALTGSTKTWDRTASEQRRLHFAQLCEDCGQADMARLVYEELARSSTDPLVTQAASSRLKELTASAR